MIRTYNWCPQMNNALVLSIYPEYVKKILSGEKRFEFRRAMPTQKITHIVIYATAPEKRIAAIAEVETILQASPHSLWKKTKYASGISRSAFRKYFNGRKQALAFKLGQVWEMPLDTFLPTSFSPPQSFLYIDNVFFQKLFLMAQKTKVVEKKTVIVAGIHGVGKTTFTNKYMVSSGWNCYTASHIIKNFSGAVNSDKKTKQKDILSNQEKLIIGMAEITEKVCDVCLDGHFTLLNSQGEITSIPSEVFHKLNPSGIILLEDSVANIQRKIHGRSGDLWESDLIELFQKEELSRAELFSSECGIPVLTIDLTENTRQIVKDLSKFLRQLYSIPLHLKEEKNGN